VVKPVPARTDQQQLSSISAAHRRRQLDERVQRSGMRDRREFRFGDPNCTVSACDLQQRDGPAACGQTNHIRVCQENGFCSAHGCVTNDLNGRTAGRSGCATVTHTHCDADSQPQPDDHADADGNQHFHGHRDTFTVHHGDRHDPAQ